MVKFSHEPLDSVFYALADPTRRAMLSSLISQERSVTELAKPFGISLPAVVKHLGVLERAGLIATEKNGRVRTCRYESAAMNEAEGWLRRHRRFWESRLDALETFLRESQDEENR